MNDRLGGGAAKTPLGELLGKNEDLRQVLFLAALAHTRNKHDAEDLFQEAIIAGLARPVPPDVANLDAVKAFFGSILNGLAINHRRKVRRRPSAPYDEDDPPPSDRAVPNPERALLEREQETARRKLKADLRACLESEPIPLQMFDLAERGVRSSKEFADLIKCSTKEIYSAQRRITYHARRLKEQAAGDKRRDP